VLFEGMLILGEGDSWRVWKDLGWEDMKMRGYVKKG